MNQSTRACARASVLRYRGIRAQGARALALAGSSIDSRTQNNNLPHKPGLYTRISVSLEKARARGFAQTRHSLRVSRRLRLGSSSRLGGSRIPSSRAHRTYLQRMIKEFSIVCRLPSAPERWGKGCFTRSCNG